MKSTYTHAPLCSRKRCQSTGIWFVPSLARGGGVKVVDPKKVPGATRYEAVSFNRVLSDDLKVMDASAVALCRDNNIPIVVFNIREQGMLAQVLKGEGTATIVSNRGE